MKLYYSPGACSLAPHIVLNELGQTHSIERVDLASSKTETGSDFAKINAKGYVPALDMGKGEILTEVSTILQYLADKAGNTELLPKAGTMERYRAMEALNFISSELHKGLGGLFYKPAADAARRLLKGFRNAWTGWKQNSARPNTFSATTIRCRMLMPSRY